VSDFPPSPITALVDAEPAFNLGESFGRALSVSDLMPQGAESGLRDPTLPYGTSYGDERLRQRIGSNVGVGAGEVLITSGAASAIFLALLVIGDDGEVVVGRPCFPPMFDAARGLGFTVRITRSSFEEGYRLDVDGLASQLSAQTRLVMLATPQNPSGVELTRAEVDAVIEAMAQRCPDAWLLLDETYREASYDDQPSPSFAARGGKVVTCGSLSKAHGAAGLRIGWLTARSPELLERLRLAKFNSAVSAGSVDEYLAIQLLDRAAEILAERRTAMSAALDVVRAWAFEQSQYVRWLEPQAGAFCCLRLDPVRFGPGQVETFHRILTDNGIIVARGEWFGDSPNIIRLGPAYVPIPKLRQALDVLATAMHEAACAIAGHQRHGNAHADLPAVTGVATHERL
jgi:aspartate/methionine/tyrosine aminotransferase